MHKKFAALTVAAAVFTMPGISPGGGPPAAASTIRVGMATAAVAVAILGRQDNE